MNSYLVVNETKVIEYNFFDKEITKTFLPVEALSSFPGPPPPVLANLRPDCQVKGVDFYFNKTNILLATVECYRTDAGGIRHHFLVQINTQTGVMIPAEIPTNNGESFVLSNSPTRKMRLAGALATTKWKQDPSSIWY